ncbi:uncharacterized protein PV09_08881 [Verruconis gallopava]|uniref:Ubiquitin 3 binding protein But2 C-terminal domain-containing protein n=1 Tax=Verruconis gallopava TaxID=253628 RepID=A0A0D1XB60_9PEZI|nr:uncharacterized protein PV09_08881 [Verruconis gallopava]KIV99455.1 hypothetical protein PV09_08881 [Verruconis gallopava]
MPGSSGRNEIIGTEIVFDNVPTNTGASYCTISFELAQTGPYTLVGDVALFDIYAVYGGFVDASDTYNRHPPYVDIKIGSVTVENGTAFVALEPVQCSSEKVQIVLLPTPGAAPFDFTWFELNDPKYGAYNGITFKQWK